MLRLIKQAGWISMKNNDEIVESLFNNLWDSEYALRFFKKWIVDSQHDVFAQADSEGSCLEIHVCMEGIEPELRSNMKKNTTINLVEEWLCCCGIDFIDDLSHADAEKLSKTIAELKGTVEMFEVIQQKLKKD